MGVGERVAKVLHVYILKKLPMSFHCTQSRWLLFRNMKTKISMMGEDVQLKKTPGPHVWIRFCTPQVGPDIYSFSLTISFKWPTGCSHLLLPLGHLEWSTGLRTTALGISFPDQVSLANICKWSQSALGCIFCTPPEMICASDQRRCHMHRGCTGQTEEIQELPVCPAQV